MKSYRWALAFIAVCVLIGGGLFVWSGYYNVGANVPHWKLTLLALEAVRERSIEVHSQGIVSPPLNNAKLMEAGVPLFHETCRLCHGAPGWERDRFAKGMYPHPPSLMKGEVQKEATDAEIFWVVKNGLKMTGMPSFGLDYSDDQIWSILAFVRQLPQVSPDDYKRQVQAIAPKKARTDASRDKG